MPILIAPPFDSGGEGGEEGVDDPIDVASFDVLAVEEALVDDVARNS